MLEFYLNILGAQVEKCQPKFNLTQLRIGVNMIDLIEVAHPLDETQHNMDHFCLQITPFDYKALEVYFESKGIHVYRYGERLGAQGPGYSFYLKDPQGNELELKEYVPQS